MIREASSQDIKAIVEIFGLSFQGSIKNLLESGANWRGIEDFFHPLLTSSQVLFYVVEEEGTLCGYLVILIHIRFFWWEVMKRGYPLFWLKNLLLGRYGIPIKSLYRLLGNKVSFLSFALKRGRQEMAQILSIGIHPQYRRKGHAKTLLLRGLEDLRREGVPSVKLEVRPENRGALHLYEGLGFKVKSDYEDSQGLWLVMVKRMDDEE